jgi:GTPase
MPVPKVAIVGRPNVGKSSILNWLAKKRISIVDPTAGVTRDRVEHLIHEGDRWFEVVDTGGIGIVDSDALEKDIERQIEVAIGEADLILFVVDGQTGRVPLDIAVADRLRPLDRPKILVVNKCDKPRTEDEVPDFYGLIGDGPVVTTSVIGNRNRDDLVQTLLAHLPPKAEFEEADGQTLAAEPEMKLAIVGRRNVGKSTFVNQLAEDERVIVSEIAGTTRDSIDIRFDRDGRTFVAIDTPGVRKRKSLANDVEFYGLQRAKKSIRRADVVLMFFDSQQTIGKVDKQLVDEIQSHHKPCIFVVNKWDLAQEAGMTTEKWDEYLLKTFGSMRHVPVAILTAIDGRNVHKIVNLAQSIHKQSLERVSTGKLNKLIRAAVDANAPAYKGNRRPKVFYGTQVAVQPPTIVLKVNDPALFTSSWKRYLLGVFREKLPFQEVPIKVYWRARINEEAVPEEVLESWEE